MWLLWSTVTHVILRLSTWCDQSFVTFAIFIIQPPNPFYPTALYLKPAGSHQHSWLVIRYSWMLPTFTQHAPQRSYHIVSSVPSQLFIQLDCMAIACDSHPLCHASTLSSMFSSSCQSQKIQLDDKFTHHLHQLWLEANSIMRWCYIPHQELRGTPQEAKYRTPSDLLTNISLFHLLYYLIWSPHLCCCSHYYIPVHHCILLTYLEQVDPCLVFY